MIRILGADVPGAYRSFATALEINPSNADNKQGLQMCNEVPAYILSLRGSVPLGDTAAQVAAEAVAGGSGGNGGDLRDGGTRLAPRRQARSLSKIISEISVCGCCTL